jgi:hypothetical protein
MPAPTGSFRPAILNCDSAGLDPTEFPEPPFECGDPLVRDRRSSGAKESDSWQLGWWLLRTGREWPRGHASETCDERSALHCDSPMSTPKPSLA